MTKEEIIRMAREAGIDAVQSWKDPAPAVELIERFAALVAAAEREAFVDKIKALTLDYKSDDYYQGWIDMRDAAEAVIRAEKQV